VTECKIPSPRSDLSGVSVLMQKVRVGVRLKHHACSRTMEMLRSSIHNCQLHLARSMKPSLFDTVHLLHAQSSPSRVSAGGILGLWSVNLPKRGTLCASQDSFRTSIMRVSSLDLGHVDGHNVWAEPCDY